VLGFWSTGRRFNSIELQSLAAIICDVIAIRLSAWAFVSVVNASYLGKNGAVTILFKILALCQRKHLILLKHSLDTLGHLVKSSQYYFVSLCLPVRWTVSVSCLQFALH